MTKSVPCQFDIKLALLGFLVGFISAGIGIGGGTILVSVLISVFGFDFKKAAGTSLATIIPITFVGALSHVISLPEISHPSYYFMFIPACVLGTLAGGKLLRKRQNGRLKIAFSVFLLIISLRMLKVVDFPFLVYSELHAIVLANAWILLVSIGICIGIIAVLLGIGCGLLIVPFYVIMMNLNIQEAITLSLTTMFFLSLSASIVHNKLRSMEIAPLKSLLIPALAGSVAGAVLSSHLPASAIKTLFGIFLFIIACIYLVQAAAVRFKPPAWYSQCRERIRKTS